jgi:bloom syndrome protein
MALTATVNEVGKSDIIQRLHIEDCQMLTSSFNRSNLHYRVMPGKAGLLDKVANFIKANHPTSTGVIYALSRDKCEQIATSLREQHDLSAWHFHAGMAAQDKRDVQDNWYRGKVKIIVATVGRIAVLPVDCPLIYLFPDCIRNGNRQSGWYVVTL